MAVQGRLNEEILRKAGVKNFKDIDERKLRDQTVLDGTLRYVEDSDLLPEQQEVLRAFRDDYITRGDVRPTSIQSALLCVWQLAKAIQKPFVTLQRHDINQFMASICREKNYTERTRIHKNVHLKFFYRWLYERESLEFKGKHPSLVAHLSTIVKERGVIHKEDLLSPTEVRSIIEATERLRDKTFIITLYESGARVSEILGLKIRDVKLEDGWIEMRIRQGKTGARSNTLVDSEPYIKSYLNTHPFKQDPKAPLFINVSKAQWGRQLRYQGILSVLRVAAKRAGITKRVHPHLLRHSRATELACVKGWNEPKLRKWHGWSDTSSTPTIYVHLAESDLQKEILQERGLLKQGESVKDAQHRIALKPKECPRCKRANAADAIACNCGAALSIEDVQNIKEIRKETNGFMQKLKDRPIQQELLQPDMRQADYHEEVIKSDQFLKDEFTRIAKEVMSNPILQQSIFGISPEPLSNNPQTTKYKDAILKLREKGLTLEDIEEVLPVGYGTIQKVCANQS